MKIAIIGNGTMGQGLVQSIAQHGFQVVMKGRSKESLDKAMGRLNASFDKLVAKGKMDRSAADGYLANIKASQDFADVADATCLF